MAIKCELTSDTDRGPGHGLLKVTGFEPTTEPVDFSLMRNQGTEPFLGRDGTWQGTEVWHSLSEVEDQGGVSVIRLGPTIVDPVVSLPPNVAFRVTLATGASKQVGTLKISRPLLGSSAAMEAAPPPPPPPPEPEPPVEAEPAPTLEPAPEPAPPVSKPVPAPQPTKKSSMSLIVAAAVLLLLVGGGSAAWFTCLFPGFGPDTCGGKPTGGTTLPKPETPKNCKGLDANACYGVATTALEAKELELARQLYQQAAKLGAVPANVRVAEMYDPDTWSAETSPEDKADWETAAYWYEEAARLGDVQGQVGAGRVLCRHAPDSFEQKRGLNFLRAASEQGGGEDVQALLKECEAKAQ